MKKLVGFVLLLVSLFSLPAVAQQLDLLEPDYAQFLKGATCSPTVGMEFVLEPAKVLGPDLLVPPEEAKGYGSFVNLLLPGNTLSWQVDIPEPGLYSLELDYLVRDDLILAPEIAITINGKYPFREARRLILPNLWVQQKGGGLIDDFGYELTLPPEKLQVWQNTFLYEASYLYSEPLLFPLEQGLNTIELIGISGEVLVGKAVLHVPEPPFSYKEYQASFTAAEAEESFLLKLEAEKMYIRNDSSIRARFERNPALTPYDGRINYLNVLDGASFSKGGQEVAWKFNVPETGFYQIAFKYKQATKNHLPVYRKISLNGKVPFGELANFPFPHTRNWAYQALGDDSGPYWFFIEKGEHTLSLQVNLDKVRPVIQTANTVMAEINELALEIQRLTGNRIDPFRDWSIQDYIPDIAERLTRWAEVLEKQANYLDSLNPTGEEVGEALNLKIAVRQLEELAEEPDEIPNRLAKLSQGSNSATELLGTLIGNLNQSPLSLDAIYIYRNHSLPPENASFFVKLQDNVARFARSFQGEQYGIGQEEDDRLQVWINRSRPFVQLLQQMINESFTPATGIKVQLSLMPDEGKLILARASKAAPDVALGVSNWLPHELAVRGALLDLRQFSGFAETAAPFSPGALIPFAYDEGIYALPETQDFWVLFYRTDLMEALNLPIPDTWDDVVDILPELQRFGLNFSVPLATFGGFKPFAGTTPFLYQWGGELYTADGMATAVDGEEALAAMNFMTELFTIYNLPQEVPNFYHHFRYGTLPLGIGNFATYVQLRTAAPEIANSWALAPHPGNLVDGEVVRWAPGSGQTAMILDQTKYPEEAWKFLTWWLSPQIQAEYAHRLQALYGETYLWNTANLEAFEDLAWPAQDKAVILEQYRWLREPSKVPGGYMLERELSNIWNRIVFDGENPRTTIDDAVIRINREITRKMAEFGFVENYRVPTINNIKEWLRDHD